MIRVAWISLLASLALAACRTDPLSGITDGASAMDAASASVDLRGATPDLARASPDLAARCEGIDERSCSVAPGCHQLYLDLDDTAYGGMGCPFDCADPDCCIRFKSCVPDEIADCTSGPVLCKRVAPRCGTGARYVISYRDGCYEGCVRPDDCR